MPGQTENWPVITSHWPLFVALEVGLILSLSS